jgi:hypothetical protein
MPDVDVYREQISWETSEDGGPLGRHIEHDPRSKDHPFELVAEATMLKVEHRRHGSPFNQGRIGSCTGNAAAGAINTEPNYHKHSPRLLVETDAVRCYERATVLDGFPGAYPPDDTGSSGLAAAKAAKEFGWLGSYKWAFGIDQALQALQAAPVITGVDWYEGFDRPDSNGKVKIAGQIRGGHEFEVFYFDPATGLVGAWNSWGLSWGIGGRFFFTRDTWAKLLERRGDVTVLVS